MAPRPRDRPGGRAEGPRGWAASGRGLGAGRGALRGRGAAGSGRCEVGARGRGAAESGRCGAGALRGRGAARSGRCEVGARGAGLAGVLRRGGGRAIYPGPRAPALCCRKSRLLAARPPRASPRGFVYGLGLFSEAPAAPAPRAVAQPRAGGNLKRR